MHLVNLVNSYSVHLQPGIPHTVGRGDELYIKDLHVAHDHASILVGPGSDGVAVVTALRGCWVKKQHARTYIRLEAGQSAQVQPDDVLVLAVDSTTRQPTTELRFCIKPPDTPPAPSRAQGGEGALAPAALASPAGSSHIRSHPDTAAEAVAATAAPGAAQQHAVQGRHPGLATTDTDTATPLSTQPASIVHGGGSAELLPAPPFAAGMAAGDGVPSSLAADPIPAHMTAPTDEDAAAGAGVLQQPRCMHQKLSQVEQPHDAASVERATQAPSSAAAAAAAEAAHPVAIGDRAHQQAVHAAPSSVPATLPAPAAEPAPLAPAGAAASQPQAAGIQAGVARMLPSSISAATWRQQQSTQQEGQQQAPAATAAAPKGKRKRADPLTPAADVPAGAAAPASAGPGSHVFAGCRFLIQKLQAARMRVFETKIRELGGTVEKACSPQVTHIAVDPGIGYEELRRMLLPCTPDTSAKGPSQPLPDASQPLLPPSAGAAGQSQPQQAQPQQGVLVLPPGAMLVDVSYIQACLSGHQRLPESGYTVRVPQPPGHITMRRSGSLPAPAAAAASDAVPAAAAGDYEAAMQLEAVASPRKRWDQAQIERAAERMAKGSGGPSSGGAGEAGGGAGGAPVKIGGVSGGGREQVPQLPVAADLAPAGPAAAAAATAENQAAQPPAAAAGSSCGQQLYPLPLGQAVCQDPHVDWGQHGRWCEPYSEPAALRTIERIYKHWMRQDLTTGAAGGSSAHAARAGKRRRRSRQRAGSGYSTSDSEDEQDSEGGGGAEQQQKPTFNTVCDHAACAMRDFCIIAELELVQAEYVGRRSDNMEFRRRAAQDAILKLKSVDYPITSKDELVRAGLSPNSESMKKCVEILGTGRLLRNKVRSQAEFQQVVRAFIQVWGVGDALAFRWYNMGYRSVEEVRQKLLLDPSASTSGTGGGTGGGRGRGATGEPQLTPQQRTGLMYYEEFNQRIPRAEMSRIEAVVQDATTHVICNITGLPRSLVSGPQAALHCRLTGSYLRGSADSGDADFIICVPAMCEDEQAVRAAGGHSAVHSPSQLLGLLLQELLARGAITQDCSPRDWESRHSHHQGEPVTYLGVWAKGGPAQSAHFRRVDIKVYPRRLLALAILYFASGQNFNRALRYYANKPTPEALAAAARLAGVPQATGIHLSDKHFAVMLPGKAVGAAGDAPAPPAVSRGRHRDTQHAASAEFAASAHVELSVSCETDVFEAMGLSYVPVHMRGLI